MKKYIIIAVIFLIVFFLIFFVGGKMRVIPESISLEKAYQEKNYQAASSFDREIVVYGKVIDGKTNEPLEDVALEVVYPHASMIPPYFKSSSKKIIKTDKNGLFLVNKIFGDGLALRGITKEGYWARNQYYVFPQVDVVTYKPDKEKPIIFKMYREVKDNYLLTQNIGARGRIYAGDNEEAGSCFYNISQGFAHSFDKRKEYKKIDYSKYDFECTVERKGGKLKLFLKDSNGLCSFFHSNNDFLNDIEITKFQKELTIEKEYILDFQNGNK